MRKDVMIKWIAALRSGKYVQGRQRLKTVPGTTGVAEHCCLGVLCEVLGMKSRPNLGPGNIVHTFGRGSCTYLPPTVVRKAGMKTSIGYVNTSVDLVALNDNGTSFEEIANLIETHYEKL